MSRNRSPSLWMPLFLLVLCSASAWAQQRRVTGRITDAATNEPLAAAQLTVPGTGVGAVSNDNGAFSILVPDNTQNLRVRRIGYQAKIVPLAAGQAELNITLARDVLRIEGVTVTGAATTLERRNAPTSTEQVNAEELTRAPAPSLDNALQGKVTGAIVRMNSGAPGGGGQIQIRGPTSILGKGDPLIVIDGVIMSNDAISGSLNSVTLAAPGASPALATTQDQPLNRLADINPNEIESIEVLKSAAASAIYGSKATNGVIVITTKRGQSGSPRFNLTQRVGTYDLIRKLGSRRFPTGQGSDTLSESQLASLEAAFGEDFVDSALAAGPLRMYDYQEMLYGSHNPSYETNIQVAGGLGSGAARYLVAATNKRENGIASGTGAGRQSLRLNLDNSFGSRWTTSFGASLLRSTAARGVSGNDNSFISPFYVFGYMPAIVDLTKKDNTGQYLPNPLFGGGASVSNPFQTFSSLKNDETVYRLIGSGRLDFQALTSTTNSVRLTTVAGIDRFDQDNFIYSPPFMQYELNDALPGTAVQSNSANRQWNASLSAVWTLTPQSNLFSATTSATVQYEQRDQNISRIRQRGTIPYVENVNLGSAPDVAQFRQGDKTHAYILNEDLLAFNERLTLQGGVRIERSSLNGDTEQYFTYPRVAAAYRFVEPLRGFDDFKLRASYGVTGNQATYGTRDLTYASFGVIAGQPALGVAGTVGNPDIKPERMNEVEVGFDAALLNSRLGLEATYFNRRVTDLLLNYPLPPSTGLGSQTVNGGELKSTGQEYALRVVPIDLPARGVNWTARASYYTFETITQDLPSNVPAFLVGSTGFGSAFGRNRQAEGVSTTSIWGSKPMAIPVRDAQGVIRRNAAGGDSVTRQVKDTILGDARPKFTMAFTNDLTWKNVSFGVLVDWRKGGLVSNLTNNVFDEGGNSRDYDRPSPCRGSTRTEIIGDPCEGADNSEDALLGAYRYDKWAGGEDARVYVQDGSFVKLREVSVGFLVPQRYTTRLFGARDFRLTFSGRNLAWWSDYWGSDPEVNNFGSQNTTAFVDLAPFPPSRSFFFSVDVGF